MADKLIGTLSISGMPLGGGSSDAVLFTPQELTTEQKTQARTNIEAVSAAEVNKAIEEIQLTPGPQGEPGKNGTNGTDGKTPVKGVDYFTEEDKTELVNSVVAALPVYNGEVV